MTTTTVQQALCANCGKPLSPYWTQRCEHCGAPMAVAMGQWQQQPQYAPQPYVQGPPSVVRVYRGSQNSALRDMQRDASMLGQQGYYPVAQMFVPGSWGAGAFIIAILLILAFGLGLLILAYLLIVKPAGTLTVTYARH